MKIEENWRWMVALMRRGTKKFKRSSIISMSKFTQVPTYVQHGSLISRSSSFRFQGILYVNLLVFTYQVPIKISHPPITGPKPQKPNRKRSKQCPAWNETRLERAPRRPTLSLGDDLPIINFIPKSSSSLAMTLTSFNQQ